MTTLDTIHQRNRDFVDHRFPGPLTLMPTLRATVIGCLDPRVDPAIVLGLNLGDAPVIRNVGGRITPAVLEILALLALGFPDQIGPTPEEDKGDLIVLHHNQCGITRMQGHPDALAASFGIDVAELPAKAVGDPRASLAVDVDLLRAAPDRRLPGHRNLLRRHHRPHRAGHAGQGGRMSFPSPEVPISGGDSHCRRAEADHPRFGRAPGSTREPSARPQYALAGR